MPRAIPVEIKVRAIALRGQGRTLEQVADALMDEFGYLIGAAALSAQVKQWSKDPRVVEALKQAEAA